MLRATNQTKQNKKKTNKKNVLIDSQEAVIEFPESNSAPCVYAIKAEQVVKDKSKEIQAKK